MQVNGEYVVGDIAEREGRHPTDDQDPSQQVGRPVADHPDGDCCRGSETEQAPKVGVIPRQQEHGGDEGNVQAHVDTTGSRAPPECPRSFDRLRPGPVYDGRVLR